MTTFILSKPITAHGDEIDALELREPTPADCRALKALPYVIGREEEVNINTEVAARYISRCADIPPSSVDQLSLGDFNTLCWQVAGFFMSGASSTQTSRST